MECANSRRNLGVSMHDQKPVIQIREHGVPQLCLHDREYFCEDPWGHCDGEGENSELVMVVTMQK